MYAVVLSQYDARWGLEFEARRAELREVFGADVRIEHIGSTAVPGLWAKPVLDILAGAQSLDVFVASAPALVRLGYRYRADYELAVPDRRYFTREGDSTLKVHLHCVLVGQKLWSQHLAFRDALRRNPALAAEYATLKRNLAVEHATNKSAYTAAKGPFVQQVLAAHGEP